MSEKWRWKIAYHLNKLRGFCWSDLVSWALGWYTRKDDMGLRDLYGGSRRCQLEGSKPGCACYCGKFRTPAPDNAEGFAYAKETND